MALRGILQKATDTAFNVVGDLAVDVTFTAGTPSAYNFGTNEVTVTEATSKTVRGIITTTDSDPLGVNRSSRVLIVKYSDVGDVDIYDSFAIGTKSYDIKVIDSNGFTVELDISGAA